MNSGEQTIEWLYNEQLKIDDEWAVKTDTGFEWWADQNKQTIELVGEEPGPDGETVYYVSVRTEMLRNLTLDEQSLSLINEIPMSLASMSGPVYDKGRQSLELCSVVKVYSEIGNWMNLLIGMTSVLQIEEARIWGKKLAQTLNVDQAISSHPQNGIRPQADELADIVSTLVQPMGEGPSRWTEDEFENTVETYMYKPPSIGATSGGAGCTVEFPYGDHSSLCQMMGDKRHSAYGAGLYIVQSFPVGQMPVSAGTELALSLNAKELTIEPSGYGFGSYAYRDGMIQFVSFIPNVMYSRSLLPNFYFAASNRAREMSHVLMGHDWDSESFSLKNSALMRAARKS